MKKILFAIAIFFSSLNLFASIQGDGYYRVKNYGSQRWASLVDNKAKVDKIAASVELHALQLSNNTTEILSDPGSIVYVHNISGYRYDMATQGTSLEALIDEPVYIRSSGNAGGQDLYQIWGTYKNITKYVADGNLIKSQTYGDATVGEIGEPDFKKWVFLPVNVNSDNYFGAVPSLNVNGDLYCTLFASFPFKPYSSGVKAYYIGRVGFGMAELKEITGTVPTSSPVIIKCAGTSAADNKLQIVETTDVLPSNSLKGVYFNYAQNSITNRVAYNPKTMRILGKTSDGSLGFITANIDYIPANTAYLTVPAGSAAEFKCVSTQEYEANLPEAPEQIFFNDYNVLQPQDNYTYTGVFNFPASTNLKFIFNYTDSNGEEVLIGSSTLHYDTTVNIGTSTSYPFSYGSDANWVIPSWNGGNLYITINLQYQFVAFSSTAGIENIVNSNIKSLRFVNGSILSDSGKEILLYDLSGRLIVSSKSGEIETKTLPKGVYVAVSDGESLKIVR